MRFYWLALRAYVRGLFHRWPDQGPGPDWRLYSSVSCGLQDFADVRGMYGRGWEPWCFQRTRYGWSRVFRVALSPEEIEVNTAMRDRHAHPAE